VELSHKSSGKRPHPGNTFEKLNVINPDNNGNAKINKENTPEHLAGIKNTPWFNKNLKKL